MSKKKKIQLDFKIWLREAAKHLLSSLTGETKFALSDLRLLLSLS